MQTLSAYVHDTMALSKWFKSKWLLYVDARMSGFELQCLQHIFFFPPSQDEWMFQQLNP